MKVEILEPKGYCAGVTNAINIALKAKEDNPNKQVTILGMLVHNEQVISFLNSRGIVVLDNSKVNIIEKAKELKEGSVVVLTAHGHVKVLDQIAKDKNFVVYDAICPKVKQNIENILNSLKNGHQVIYIGLKGHPEAEAALSLDKNVIFYDIKSSLDYSSINDKEPLVVNQTTLNILDIKNIHEDILKNIPKAKIENEICAATRMRQESIVNLPNDVDLIIVVGDKKSSNTNRLLEIARNSHPNIESLMISDASELNISCKQNKNHIVIASGASTPLQSINVIFDKLLNN